MTTPTGFLGRLAAAQHRHQSLLCVGLDPEPAKFPAPWTGDAALAYGRTVLGASAGLRSGALRESWLVGRVTARLIPQASLMGELGRSPSNPLTDRAGGRYAAVGLVLTTGPRADH